MLGHRPSSTINLFSQPPIFTVFSQQPKTLAVGQQAKNRNDYDDNDDNNNGEDNINNSNGGNLRREPARRTTTTTRANLRRTNRARNANANNHDNINNNEEIHHIANCAPLPSEAHPGSEAGHRASTLKGNHRPASSGAKTPWRNKSLVASGR